jgi:hypothetical protein
MYFADVKQIKKLMIPSVLFGSNNSKMIIKVFSIGLIFILFSVSL